CGSQVNKGNPAGFFFICAYELKGHQHLFSSLHLRHSVKCSRSPLYDQETRHATEKLEGDSPVLVGMVPEGATRVVARNLDQHEVSSPWLHLAEDIIGDPPRGNRQPMRVEIGRVAIVWESSHAFLFGVRGEAVDQFNCQDVSWFHLQGRARNSTFVGWGSDRV